MNIKMDVFSSSDEDMMAIAHSGTTTEDAAGAGLEAQLAAAAAETHYGMPSTSSAANPPSMAVGVGGADTAFGGGGGGDDIPGLGQYEDFHTIDWQRDIARDRMRHRFIVKKRGDSILDLIKGAHDAWSGWLCVLLVGLCSGMLLQYSTNRD